MPFWRPFIWFHHPIFHRWCGNRRATACTCQGVQAYPSLSICLWWRTTGSTQLSEPSIPPALQLILLVTPRGTGRTHLCHALKYSHHVTENNPPPGSGGAENSKGRRMRKFIHVGNLNPFSQEIQIHPDGQAEPH